MVQVNSASNAGTQQLLRRFGFWAIESWSSQIGIGCCERLQEFLKECPCFRAVAQTHVRKRQLLLICCKADGSKDGIAWARRKACEKLSIAGRGSPPVMAITPPAENSQSFRSWVRDLSERMSASLTSAPDSLAVYIPWPARGAAGCRTQLLVEYPAARTDL